MKDIHQIAQELINSGAVSPSDFHLSNNELTPKDEYTCNFIVSQIKALGYDCLVKDGKILLTGETVSEEVGMAVEKLNTEDVITEDYIGGSSMLDSKETLDEVKDIPGDLEKIRTASELRRLIEDLYNKAEDTVFAFGEYQDSGTVEAKGYLVGLQQIVHNLGVLKNKMNGTYKPIDPTADF